jgi:hypothetical protein
LEAESSCGQCRMAFLYLAVCVKDVYLIPLTAERKCVPLFNC